MNISAIQACPIFLRQYVPMSQLERCVVAQVVNDGVIIASAMYKDCRYNVTLVVY